MDIFNWDITTWVLVLALVAAFVAYAFWPQTSKAQSEVKRDDETRKQAQPLIALAAADQQQLFELTQVPLGIHVTTALRDRLASEKPPEENEIRESLWAQQRGMITRLESELDYAQQADISACFAIAAPANQPAALLQKTLSELEGNLKKIRTLLGVQTQEPFWHGRAMILMLSTRKLFDHVAWLTGAGLAASAPGAFMLSEEGVVLISLYATRLGGFTRPLTLQVCRAAVKSLGGSNTPPWMEYGLAYWLTDQIAPKPPALAPAQVPACKAGTPQAAQEEEIKWDQQKSPAILELEQWTKAADDSVRLEHLVTWSALYVTQMMTENSGNLLRQLHSLRQADSKTLMA